jgi:putative PEP-CTERM system histidine kinase
MTGFGIVSYAAAALSFLLLTVLLIASWQGRRPGAHLIAASAATTVWAAVLALESAFDSVPFLILYFVEIVRDCAWLFALLAVAGAAVPRFVVIGTRLLCGLLLVAPLGASMLQYLGGGFFDATMILSRAGLAAALVALVLLEQIYRNAPQEVRRSLQYFALGVGVLFAYDLFLYSQTELLRNVAADAWNTRGILGAFAVPLLAIAVRRNPQWSLELFVSRQVVFYTTTFMAVGVYLVVMALGGYYVREVGGSWGRIGQIVFFAGAAVVLATLLASAPLRRHAQVFINKHFYRNKYDYRIEWLRFIATLSSTEEEDVRRTALRAIAQIFSSPGGVLFLLEDNGRGFAPYAAWPMRMDSLPEVTKVAIEDDLPRFLQRTQWIIDTREYRAAPDIYGNIRLPDWLHGQQNLRIVSPLLQLDKLAGFVVLYDPPPPFELNYEDRDLLKTLGRHVATHIAQHDADRKLAEGRQFEAYNRLTAFMMHDLKNSVAQLKLIVANAERHKRNPEFVDDAIGTIANASDRMTRLIEQLRGTPASARLIVVDLLELVRKAVASCAARNPRPTIDEASASVYVQADPERLVAVIEHVIRNAQDATMEQGAVQVGLRAEGSEVVLTVTDTGTGMEPEFVRDRLFRPFDSTKGSKGMGIGAYQAREYVRVLGGDVEVQSSPGRGTSFSISLPVFEGQAVRRAGGESG